MDEFNKCLDLARDFLATNQLPIQLELFYSPDVLETTSGPLAGQESCCIFDSTDPGCKALSSEIFYKPFGEITAAFANTAMPVILNMAVTEYGYRQEVTAGQGAGIGGAALPEYVLTTYRFVPPPRQKG